MGAPQPCTIARYLGPRSKEWALCLQFVAFDKSPLSLTYRPSGGREVLLVYYSRIII